MFKVLFRLFLTFVLLIAYIFVLLLVSLWYFNYKEKTSYFISHFMDIWDISIDDLYVISKH